MADERIVLPVRLVVENPVPSVRIALQRGATAKGERVQAIEPASDSAAFGLELVVEGSLADGRPRLLGPFVQGPPRARFVYLCIGQAAGQGGSEWNRRIKVPIGDISWGMIRALPAGKRLEARIAGRDHRGDPACASVPLLPTGWRIGD